ncbi:MAG: SOS response-associated peptidase [Cyanobacteria bacterium J06642_2]
MCGRFALAAEIKAIAKAFGLQNMPDLPPRYNIAPSQPVAVVRASNRKERELAIVQWGLIPSWTKDVSKWKPLINARAETAAEKPSFRTAFRRRRCLIPASGFYEWQKVEGGKQPFFIHQQGENDDLPLFAFAGLWERWQGANGDELESCTILTTTANAAMKPIHNRMPIILVPRDYDAWLLTDERDVNELRSLLHPIDDEWVSAYPVSTTVNNPRNDVPECLLAREVRQRPD